MWRVFFLLVLPVLLIVGGLIWYFGAPGGLPWQSAGISGVEPAPVVQQDQVDQAQGAGAKGKGPGWALNCSGASQDEALVCRLSQTVVLKESGKVLTEVTFVFPATSSEPQLNVKLPLGVLLSAGTEISVDGETPQKLGFRTCDRNGCYAQASVSPQMLTSLRKGRSLTVEFKDLSDKTVRLPLSLDGFGDAYDKLKSA
jgi:invasion protein IalB